MALQDTFDMQLEPLASLSGVERIAAELRAEMGFLRQDFANGVMQIQRDAAEREARQARMILTATAIILAGIGIATGVIIALT